MGICVVIKESFCALAPSQGTLSIADKHQIVGRVKGAFFSATERACRDLDFGLLAFLNCERIYFSPFKPHTSCKFVIAAAEKGIFGV